MTLPCDIGKLGVLAWNRHKNVAGLNWLMSSQPFPLDNLISIDKEKQI
jgi:hypothetical protein